MHTQKALIVRNRQRLLLLYVYLRPYFSQMNYTLDVGRGYAIFDTLRHFHSNLKNLRNQYCWWSSYNYLDCLFCSQTSNNMCNSIFLPVNDNWIECQIPIFSVRTMNCEVTLILPSPHLIFVPSLSVYKLQCNFEMQCSSCLSILICQINEINLL